jgi:hypothetical protein
MRIREWNSNTPFRTSSTQYASLTYGTPSLLPLIIDDPIGDATDDVDISEIRGYITNDMILLQIVTATPLNPTNFLGYLGLDVDRNKTTGIPLPYGSLTHDIGCEYFLQFLDITSQGIQLRDPLWTLVGQYTPIIDTMGNTLTFSIPRTDLKSDSRSIHIASVFGTTVGPTDFVPDAGHATVMTSWLLAVPDGGEVTPSGSAHIMVQVKSDDLDGREFFAELIVTTNDPALLVTKVPVQLTMTPNPSLLLDEEKALPKVFALYQNYPNPFNPSTTIKYDIPKRVHVHMTVYNILGEQIMTLVDENQPAGVYTVPWNSQTKRGLTASGIYFVAIHAGDFSKTMKMILIK